MSDPESLLCVTVTAPTMNGLRAGRDAAEGADLVELRLDHVDRPDVAEALRDRRCPVIVTCRARWEGGLFAGTEEDRHRILEAAIVLGAEFVDVEAAAAFAPELIRARSGRGIVASVHDFSGSPADLAGRYRTLRGMGAEISKLAVMPGKLGDLLPLFDLAKLPDDPGRSHVLIGMGTAGIPSRVLAARLRNRWTYAGNGAAPGQLPAERMLREYRFRRIRQDAALYGVVGKPIGHSRSPVMHNAGFAALGLNAVYVPLEAADAADLAHFARAMSMRGVSITAPYKIALMDYVDDVDEIARRVGAINTIVTRDGRWIGSNTDVDGITVPLRHRIALKGARASVLGASGAARAAAVALADGGAAVTICARRPDAARAIADLVGGQVGSFPPQPGTWDVLINATSGGSGPGGTNPIAGASLDGRVVFDLIYDPIETALLRDAKAAGCDTIGGLEMLIAQAERQFELWTGQRPPEGLFRAAAIGHGAPEGAPAARLGHTESNTL